MVRLPVISMLVTGPAVTLPTRALPRTAIFAGPPLAPPASAWQTTVNSRVSPEYWTSFPKMTNRAMRVADILRGIPQMP